MTTPENSSSNRQAERVPEKQTSRTRQRIPLTRKLLFALVTVVCCFALLEGLLALAGVQLVNSVERMEFTFPIDDYNNNAPEPFLRRDPILFWTPRPNVQGHNSQGLYGPEFNEEKPEDVFRILCLGDSCTHFGPEPYPAILQQLLDQQQPGKFEVINAGVIGYTSYQGRKLLETRAVNWSPDLITCYFGWNDHWLSSGRIDSQQTVTEPSLFSKFGNRLRTVQTIRMISSRGPQNIPQVRVPEIDYRNNLHAIAKTGQSVGSEVFFITAPHAFDLSIPDYLLTSGEVADPDSLIPMHQSYNDQVRLVAQASRSELLDMERAVDQLEKGGLFIDDHIHLSLEGRRMLAEELCRRVLRKLKIKVQ